MDRRPGRTVPPRLPLATAAPPLAQQRVTMLEPQRAQVGLVEEFDKDVVHAFVPLRVALIVLADGAFE